MGKMHLPFFCLLSLLLLAPGWTASPGTNQSFHKYLERAESEGIIGGRQVQDLLQLARAMDLEGRVEETPEPPAETAGPTDKRTTMFMHVYNHLTMLNVLYLCGAVTIMGAYSLFMTLAYEQCGYGTLSLVVLVQVVMCGYVGVDLWFSEYAYVGGL